MKKPRFCSDLVWWIYRLGFRVLKSSQSTCKLLIYTTRRLNTTVPVDGLFFSIHTPSSVTFLALYQTKWPPRGGFTLPETLVLGTRRFHRRYYFRRRCHSVLGILPVPLGCDSSRNVAGKAAGGRTHVLQVAKARRHCSSPSTRKQTIQYIVLITGELTSGGYLTFGTRGSMSYITIESLYILLVS